MEAVKAFNSELSSLYEVKPPISKAKMTALTRGAIKAIKFYKHVVQSVEKFILKCKPEYKVPGLYVIDSIVRQSRHQFGSEKDVFAPRFSKNLQHTFVNLFKCPPEDKSKIIRVLNLWQKNQVFSPEAIQPLFDLADPNNPIHQQFQQSTPLQQTNGSQQQVVVKGSPALQRTPTKVNQSATSEAATPNLNLTEPVLQQLQQLQRLLTKGTDSAANRPEQVHFDKKLLDFDYDEDEEEVNPSPRPPPPPSAISTDPVASLLTNPEVLRQLQTLQNTLAGAVNPPPPESESERMRKLHEMKMQEDEFDKHLAQTVPNLPFASECEFKLTQTSSMIGGLHFIPPQPEPLQMPPGFDMQLDNNALFGGQNNSNDVEVITLDHEDSHSDDGRYKRKRSRSRSRDRDRDKDDRRRRSRSRSRSRGRRHRSKSKDRKEKDKREKEKETERDKERKKRGLPAIKRDNLSVCSTTLWVGHISKLVHQDDLSNTFGEFGEIVSIDLIVPRGCAFIVMHRRQDAARCLAKLKNYNLHGKALTLAWAPGKGVKGKDLKDYWEGDLGVSYIPWNKLKEDMDLEALEDGGMLDEDTMPEWMRNKIEETTRVTASEHSSFVMGGNSVGDTSNHSTNHSTVDTSQPPPLPPSNMMQPPMLPMMNPFQLNNRFIGMIPNLANLPLGVPPPNMAPPNMPPSMMPNLGLGLGSPFQGPPSFMPPNLPPPQRQESKPTPSSMTDAKLRNLSESLMNLAGQPLTLPPLLSQPPPPLHHAILDDNMDVEMEDAILPHPDMNKPPPNIPLSEQLQASLNSLPFNRDNRRGDELRFSPNRRDSRDRDNRRDDRSSERGRRRSRSRDRDQNRDRDRNDRSGGRDRDRRERDNRERDFGRGSRDRDRDRDRRAGDRERGNRWGPPDRRDDRGDRRDGPYDRRGGGPVGRRDGNDRRDDSFDRRDGPGGRRDGPPERRDPDIRDKGEREKSLNDRLKEMAGLKFDEDDKDRPSSPRSRQLSDTKEEPKNEGGLRFEPPHVPGDSFSMLPPPLNIRDDVRSPREARNPSPPDFTNQVVPEEVAAPPPSDPGQVFEQNVQSAVAPEGPLEFINPTPAENVTVTSVDDASKHQSLGNFEDNEAFRPNDAPAPFNDFGGPGFNGPGQFGSGPFGPNGPSGFGPDGAGNFGPDGPGRFGPDGPSGFGPDGPGNFGPDGPGRFGPDVPGNFGPDGPGNFGPDGPGRFGPDVPGNFGPDGPSGFGPDGPSGFGPDGPGNFGPDGPGGFGPVGPGHFGPDGPGSFGPDGPGSFGPDGPGRFGPDEPGRFGPDGPGPGRFEPDEPGRFGPDGPGPGRFEPDEPGRFEPDGPGRFGPDEPGRFGRDEPGRFGRDEPGRFGRDEPGRFGSDESGRFEPDEGRFGSEGSGHFGRNEGRFGPEGPGRFGPDGPDRFVPGGPGRFGPDKPRFRDQGPPFIDDSFGPPPDMMLDGPPNFGPPERFMRGGRRGRGRGRGRGGRDGPDFFKRDDFGPPPMMDEGFGPPMRDDFGPPPMRGDDFGPRGMRMPRRGFFGRGGPRGRGGGPPFAGFNPEFEGGPPPPDFFRGGPRGRPFGDPFHRGGRGRGGFRGGRGRPDFFDGPPPPEFFDGPPHFDGGHPFEGPGFDGGPPGDMPPDFDGRRGRGRKRGRSSRWGNEEFEAMEGPFEGGDGGNGGGTPLRDEIDDCGPQVDFASDVMASNAGPLVQEPMEVPTEGPPGE